MIENSLKRVKKGKLREKRPSLLKYQLVLEMVVPVVTNSDGKVDGWMLYALPHTHTHLNFHNLPTTHGG